MLKWFRNYIKVTIIIRRLILSGETTSWVALNLTWTTIADSRYVKEWIGEWINGEISRNIEMFDIRERNVGVKCIFK